ncbi:hypothetical protein PsYK624_099890 [Phanerochaete sordida]|uniref:Uncharacterized protein n=1 Tax=Phanerochaete sordida TaxID=48140 RepID=A0A9P3GHK8_9APHY|nr:hypothetical protein PsYK624_099890 [Phanerochaete sordida]
MPWLALHLVLTSTYRNKEKTETAEAWADLMSQQHDFGSRTFCDNSSRRHILLNPGCLGRDVVLWEPQSTVVRVVKELDALFAELTAAYQQVEAGAGPGLAGLDACCAAVADSMAERMASLIKNTLRSHANLRRVSPEQVKPPVRQKREVVWRRRPRHLVFHNGEVVDVISGW